MVRKLAIAFVCAVAVLAAAFGFYVGDYYRADRSVDEYLASDSSVMVEQADMRKHIFPFCTDLRRKEWMYVW